MLVFCGLSVQRERGESVRDHIDRFGKSVHTALCVLCSVSMILYRIDQMSHCLDGSTSMKGNERATQTPSGGWCAPDCAHKGPPCHASPPSPLREWDSLTRMENCLDTSLERGEEVFDAGYEKTGIYKQDEENI